MESYPEGSDAQAFLVQAAIFTHTFNSFDELIGGALNATAFTAGTCVKYH